MRKFDLEERLIEFAVLILGIAASVPKTNISMPLAGQLGRSGTAVALNYAEAQSAESRKDFVHKLKVALKELRETQVCLKIIKKVNWIKDTVYLDQAMSESNQLISILMKSIETATNNMNNEKLNK
jgi:four helix bundle protein